MVEVDLRAFGASLREARLAAGLTQRDVRRRTGLDIASISRIESGDANPGLKTLLKLAHALGVPLTVPAGAKPDPASPADGLTPRTDE